MQIRIRKWETKDTAFHSDSVNPSLLKHREAWLRGVRGARVLVPLCGKSVDLSYLASLREVREVVGVELAAAAVEALAVEQPGLRLRLESPAPGAGTSAAASVLASAFRVYRGMRAVVLNGDFFATPAACPPLFDAVWDRAALVAMEPSQRARYADTLAAVLRPGGRLLLSTFERAEGTPAGRAAGPPYSVSTADVAALFGARGFRLELLELEDLLERPDYQRFKAQGLTRVLQATWLLTKGPSAREPANR